MFRTIAPQQSLWASVLPEVARGLSPRLAKLGSYFDDPRLFEPFRPYFHPTDGHHFGQGVGQLLVHLQVLAPAKSAPEDRPHEDLARGSPSREGVSDELAQLAADGSRDRGRAGGQHPVEDREREERPARLHELEPRMTLALGLTFCSKFTARSRLADRVCPGCQATLASACELVPGETEEPSCSRNWSAQ